MRSHRQPIRLRTRVILASVLVTGAILVWAAVARAFAPTGNTSVERFDAIIILGAHNDRDGNPTPALLARITEGVHEYERGVAPRLIVTGGPDRGNFVQAAVMARVAEAQGVPVSAIVQEPQAENTIENACFTTRIMKERGWQSAEIVTSASHLPRAGMVFNRMPIEWRGHVAPSLAAPGAGTSWDASGREVLHTAYYLVFSQWADRCSP